jgi:hypothetical protein
MNSLESIQEFPFGPTNSQYLNEFMMAEWEFLFRLVRIHTMEDEFTGLKKNPLEAPVNSPECLTNSHSEQ